MSTVVLDSYNYTLLPDVVRIEVEGFGDPDIVDIMSELHETEGRFYLEGEHYVFLGDYELYYKGDDSTVVYLDLKYVR